MRVMAPRKTKKKSPKSRVPSQEVLSNRRSSLQVNLSFVSSLSDSGNGSLRKSQPENDEPVEQDTSPFHRDQLSNITEDASSVACAEDAALSAINEKEKALDRSCCLLKDAILNKTRELFDGEAELAVKTNTILKGQRCVLKEINENSKSIIDRKKSLLSKTLSTNNSISKNRLETNSSKFSSKTNSPPLARISKDASFIVSGSNESYRKNGSLGSANKVLKVRLTRVAVPRLRTSSESSQASSIGDEIGAPLTCSSFISGHGNRLNSVSQRAESDDRQSEENSDGEEPSCRAESLGSSLTPMEITAVQGGIPSTSRKSYTGLRALGSATRRSEASMNLRYLEAVPMELTPVQSHIPFRESAIGTNSAGTSLNVNTSADDLSRKPKKESSVVTAIIREIDENRVDTVAPVSLRVNTSLGTEESPVQETENNSHSTRENTRINNTKNDVTDRNNKRNSDSIENLSLIARLRNLSSRKSKEPSKLSIDRVNRSSRGDGPSFVEGTPFPPSKSLLWKTQIRLENKNRNKTSRRIPSPDARDRDSDDSMTTEYLTPPNDSVVLDDSPPRENCRETTSNPRVIPDSSDEDKPLETAAKNVKISKENATPNIRRSGKKKLLSLYHDIEPVSLSPLSPAVLSPKKQITWKPRRKLQKRKALRVVAAERIEAMRVEDEEDEEPSCTVASRINTQNEGTKPKKPRKVISKKIVVKKIAGLDILEKLESMGRAASERESTAGGRSSINEFTKMRRLPRLGRVLKTEKLIIVATGFAKGDVDLIKRIAKDLGGAEISSIVSRRTTHVVSTGVRTINLLRGIIRGCWLVSLDWVLKSLENEKWLNAEQYEMIHFSKAVQENRRDRQLFGKAYVPELFTTCGPIYIEHGSTPPAEILKELVKTAGGRIAENEKNAKLSVGPEGLREIWILDSITTGDLQPIEEYKRK